MNEFEYSYVRQQVLKLTGVDLHCYKPAQMQRRLQAYLRRTGYPDWPRLFRVLRKTPTELEKFRTYLTINVTTFFRDPQKYEVLHNDILPELLNRRRAIRVWSAGCSRGQEPYSLAILLNEVCQPGQSFRILATDIDKEALSWARAGGPYAAEDLIHVSAYQRERYFRQQEDAFWVKDDVRRQILFQPRNLLSDPVVGKFDLIVCRNVVIYFEAEAKKLVYQKFYDALRPHGILFVGGAEMIARAGETNFELVHLSFYKRSSK